MKNVSRYMGGHLFRLDRPMSAIERQLAEKLGGLTEEDFQKFESFKGRTNNFTKFSHERGCVLYIDAEQSFLQGAIESFGQQLTH